MPVIAADTRRPIFMGGRACRCLRPALGALREVGNDSTSYACGNPPNRSDYSFPDDRELYRMDLADYKACIGQPQDIYSSTPVDAPPPPPPPPPDPVAEIVTQVLAPYTGLQTYQYWHDFVYIDVQQGMLDHGGDYASGGGSCSGSSGPDPTMQEAAMGLNVAGAGTAAGMSIAASTDALAASTAGMAIPIIGAGIAVADLFMWLFSRRHAYSNQLVHILCQSVRTVNQVLAQIDAELNAGLIDSDKAISALSQLQSSFENVIAPVKGMSSGNYAETGNDAELMSASLQAIILYRQQTYPGISANVQAQIAQQKEAAAAAQQQQIQSEVNQAVATAMAAQAPPPPPPPSPVVAAPTPAPATGPPTQTTGPAPTVSVPSASSSWTDWFTKNTPMFGWQVPNWALVLGGAILLLGD